MAKLKDLLGLGQDPPPPDDLITGGEETLGKTLLQEDQQEDLEQDISILDDGDGSTEQRLQKVAEKEVQTAAEESLKKLHVIQLGRCPLCGEHLRQHLFATICEACGWHNFDTPKNGPVRVHLRGGAGVVEGERCYTVKTGIALVLNRDVVVAKVPRDGYDWIEYIWRDEDIEQRHKQVADRLSVSCGWCSGRADVSKDGFHLVHIAFGATQERYCFCSDECYEAFRKMYPARVHRDCYERNCSECNLCLKRYGDEEEGIRMLAKDYLYAQRSRRDRS